MLRAALLLALPAARGTALQAWQRTRYSLHAAGLVDAFGEVSAQDLAAAPCLGSAVSTAAIWPRDSAAAGTALRFDFAGSSGALTVEELPWANAGLGHTIWGSGVALALFLRTADGRAALMDEGGGTSGPRALELGAGVGLPGLELVRSGLARRVTLSDREAALLDGLRRSAAALGSYCSSDVRVSRIDWAEPAELEVEILAAGGAPEVVLAADVCYYASQARSLLEALRVLRPRLALIAGPARRAETQLLAKLFREEGLGVTTHRVALVSRDADVPAGPTDDEAAPASLLRGDEFVVLEVASLERMRCRSF